jgi:hypothetical protein
MWYISTVCREFLSREFGRLRTGKDITENSGQDGRS